MYLRTCRIVSRVHPHTRFYTTGAGDSCDFAPAEGGRQSRRNSRGVDLWHDLARQFANNWLGSISHGDFLDTRSLLDCENGT